ncbi:hypothetical protein ElyMa_004145100 [Elysia marginata]|uniref:Uncharacterized protein n=1 Tax=Elysia marginata TaxID=1093978 RepID=A0AAV4GEP5_9GAST|nr:hypothetical protein ElyMa_004145100 [Elysia marginata]
MQKNRSKSTTTWTIMTEERNRNSCLMTARNTVSHKNKWQRGGLVSASDSRCGGRGFDSRPCHVAIALGK